MPFDDSDQTLVGQIKAGDVKAFEILHRRYHGRIYRLAMLRLGNTEDAADVAANTFCKALRGLATFQFRRGATLYPWLHRIAMNLIVDALRQKPPGGMLSLDAQIADEVSSFLECLPDDGLSPQHLVERGEMQELVRQAINQLPADQARAVSLRFLGDFSIREIAQELDRSEGAVKSLLHRALSGMRRHLKSSLTAGHGSPVVRSRRQERAENSEQEVVHVRQRDAGT